MKPRIKVRPAVGRLLGGWLIVMMVVSCGQDPNARAAELLKEGLAAQSSGDLNLALLKYTDAIDLNPGLFTAYLNRGNIKVQSGLLDGARADYQRASELDPEHFGVIYNLGLIEHLTSNFDAAMAAYNRAIALEPDNGQIYLNRGSLYYALGNREAAIGDLKRVLDTAPEAPDAHMFRGIIYYDSEEYNAALEHYKQAGDSVYVRLRTWLAESHLGKRSEADEELRAYLATLGENDRDPIGKFLVRFCLGLESEAQMMETLNDAQNESSPGLHATLCFYMGSLRLLNGDENGATEIFKRGVEKAAPMQSEYLSMKAYLAAAGN